ncbi:MAG: HIT family protein [Dysgonomonas sp.]
MATVFSRIIKGEIPSCKVYEDEKFYAFLDINPMSKGHTLLIPKTETDYIYDLDDNTISEMFVVSKKIAKAIKKVIPCKRVGIMVLGMEVPHAHIHLIPINKESDMNLSNKRIQIAQEELKNIAEEIKSNLPETL